MATTRARRKADGSIRYTADVRLRKGTRVHVPSGMQGIVIEGTVEVRRDWIHGVPTLLGAKWRSTST